MDGMDFTCASCGERHGPEDHHHDDWPALAFHYPDAYAQLTAEERESIARADDDLCVITHPRGTDRFVRVTLSIPIRGEERTLEYGLWSSLSEASFTDYVDHYEDPEHHTHYFGWLATAIPGYDLSEPMALEVTTHGLERPSVRPDPSVDHPLVHDVYKGITREEAELRIRSVLLDDDAI